MKHMTACVSMLLLLSLWVGIHPASADDLSRWIAEAKSGSETVRLRALQALGDSGKLRALPPLLEALKDRSAIIREQAAASLRTFTKTMQQWSGVVAAWVEHLLQDVEDILAPSKLPKVERTEHKRYL